VEPIPAGLKIVAGNQSAKTRQSKNVVAWSCGSLGGKPRFHAVRQCEENQLLQLQVTFRTAGTAPISAARTTART
jgi:hypothetical protein